MNCQHCKQDIGKTTFEVDEYDLMTSHRWNCQSKIGNKVREGLEKEFNGQVDTEQ